MTLPTAVAGGELVTSLVPIASRYAVQWYGVAFALLLPTCLLALADARLRGRI